MVDKENYIYTKNKESADRLKIYWRCENRSCKARLHTDENYIEIKKFGTHNHASTAAEVNARTAVSNIKAKSISSRDAPRSIIAGEVEKLNECALSQIPQLEQLSKNIRRWRQADLNYPATPQTNVGFSIPSEYSRLDTNEIFLQYDSGIEDSSRILIFASDEALRHLKVYKNWAADGTFKCCSSIFFQLYIVHVQMDTLSVPRLFALLSNKSQNTYNRLFAKISELLQDEGPDCMIMDFEKAAHNGFLESFPASNLACCLFHLGQNVYKHIVQEGMKSRYHQDDSFSLKMRSFVALAFLPVDDVVDGYEELVDDDDIPQSVVSYFENNYIGPLRGRGERRRRLEPPYPLTIWNVWDRCMSGIARTTNSLEGYHNALKVTVNMSHPNIWKLIDVLKCEERFASAKLQKFIQGDEPSQKKKYRDMNLHIKNVMEKYDPNQKITFLKAIAHNLKF